ncbi:unnamed protein product [Alopecurus aequalis]
MNAKGYFSRTMPVDVHGEQTIEVTYTNDPAEVQRVLDMYQQWIATGEEMFIGLDLEYTSHKDEKDKKIAVLQLAFRRHVLVFHYSSSDWWQSLALADFFRFSGVKFASVDTSNDKLVLGRTWNFCIPDENYEDIQDLYYDVYKQKKAGMAPMAEQLIDPWYKDMKKKHYKWHDYWDKDILDMDHIIYATIDGFISLELCRVLKPMSDAAKKSKKTREGGESSRANRRRRWY